MSNGVASASSVMLLEHVRPRLESVDLTLTNPKATPQHPPLDGLTKANPKSNLMHKSEAYETLV